MSRLLVIEPGVKLWGSERAFLATVPALAEAHESVVVMVPPGAELAKELLALPVTVVTAPIGNLRRSGRMARARAVASILAVCLRHGIQKVYLNQAGLCRIVQVVVRLLGLPCVIHVRLLEDVKRCGRLRATSRSRIFLIMISDSMRAHFIQQGPENLRVVRAYDPFVLSHPTTGDALGADAKKTLPANRVACIGRLAHSKGQLCLIEAVGELVAAGVELSIDMIGEAAPGDSYKDELLRRCRQLGLNDLVHWLGYQKDARNLLSAYRFIVVSSLYEPLGRVIFEAWDAGAVPICSAASGGAAEVMQASGGGLLYEAHNSANISAALRIAFAMDENARLEIVERGRAWARDTLSIAHYRAALSGILFP